MPPVTVTTIERWLQLQADLRGSLAKLEATTAKALDVELRKLAADMIRLVSVGSNAEGNAIANEAQAQRILDAFQRRARKLIGEQEVAYKSILSRRLSIMGDGIPKVYSAFGRATAGEFLGVRDSWLKATGNVNDGTGLRGLVQWRNELRKVSADLYGGLSDNLMTAKSNNWSQRRTVQELLSNRNFDRKNLPPVDDRFRRIISGGTMDEDIVLTRRAHMIARTENTASVQAATEKWAQEAGLEKFVNVNGDPVSEKCKGANRAGAMTMDEWAASEWGTPPRHPNCDSYLMPVPPTAEDAFDGLTLGDFFDDPEAARAALSASN